MNVLSFHHYYLTATFYGSYWLIVTGKCKPVSGKPRLSRLITEKKCAQLLGVLVYIKLIIEIRALNLTAQIPKNVTSQISAANPCKSEN